MVNIQINATLIELLMLIIILKKIVISLKKSIKLG